MNLNRRHWIAAAIALAISPLAGAQSAGDWPARPVRLIVPGPPAGGTDILARLLAEQLSKAFGKPFVIENKPGANGMIGSETVAHAAPDGHTLLFSYAGAMVVNPSLYVRALDPLKSFEPIAQIGSFGNLLVVSPVLPVHNLRELADYARKRPGELNYGTWGVGSGGHLTMEIFLQRAKVTMHHVPYKGAASVATDVQGGTLPVGWTDVTSQIQQVRAGRLRALAVSGTSRLPQLPEVPTMSEQGYPFETTSWYGLFAPARTPAAIVDRLNAEVNRIIATPEFKARLAMLNLPAAPTVSAAQFRNVVAKDTVAWRAVVQAAGVRPE
ncbi:tripartite tricarboxylate transporter substrate binding protein [Cupriavidus taiwanensis]|nr:tripartite tricarboxylate transporter substrate binding protein [Cupriavidus taiwanensis]NSX17448.1 tripartite tricarboxylate transporter substrate binding protein [Cupriavidus taiwanensis]